MNLDALRQAVPKMQEAAIARPCLLSIDTLRKDYGWMFQDRSGTVTIRLTVNAGYE